jgi:hypothetical protein
MRCKTRAPVMACAAFMCLSALTAPLMATAARPLTDVHDIIAAPFSCLPASSTAGADDSACIQSAIDTAGKAGGGVVWIPAGFWNLTAQVVIKPNVTVQCVGNGYLLDANTLNYAAANGAIFAVLWGAGSGASNRADAAAFQLNHGAAIKDCGFWYPGQSATAASPTEYGSTILAYDTSAQANTHQTASGDWCANCYNFLDFRGSISGLGMSGAEVSNNVGSPIHYGLAIDFLVDWGSFHDNHWNSGAIYAADPSPATHLRGWIATNGTGWRIGYSDWVMLRGEQAWGYHIGALVDFATACCGAYRNVGPVTLRNVQFDATYQGVGFAGAGGLPLKLLGGTFTAFNPYTNARGSVVAVRSGANLSSLQLNGINVFGPTEHVVQACEAREAIGNVSVVNVMAATTVSGGAAYAFCSGPTATLKSLYIAGSTFTGFSELYTAGQVWTDAPVVSGNFR